MKETTEITLNKSQLPSWLATFSATQKPQHIIITLPEEEHWLKKDLKPLVAARQSLRRKVQACLMDVRRRYKNALWLSKILNSACTSPLPYKKPTTLLNSTK